MLDQLQDHLSSIYQVDAGYDVRDFLVTDPMLARILGQGSLIPDTQETVLVAQTGDEIELSIFLDEALLSRLEDCRPLQKLEAHQLADLWTVLEGLSHFNYIAWSAARDKRVTLLELEMQAEVDKFVSTWLLAQDQKASRLARKLHGWLFDRVSFSPELDADQRARYEAANRYAARFCHGLGRRMQHDSGKGLNELRRFYRLSQPDKISHIHAQAYCRSPS